MPKQIPWITKTALPIARRAREEGFTDADVKPGAPATINIGSDYYGATVVDVRRNKAGEVTRITVREDKARGFDSSGEYARAAVHALGGENAREMSFSRRADGAFRSVKTDVYRVSLGVRATELDRSF
jgi:hypothetical protein